MKNILSNRKLVIGLTLLSVLAVLVVAQPNFALAETTPASQPATSKSVNWLDCALSAQTCAINLVSVLLNQITGLLINLGGWLIGLALKFDTTILASPAVSTGFGIMLALANLGFVLAVILIAIATILHWQEYELKKILWRVLVMAVLVNFSLVLSGMILKVSDDLTLFFANQMAGGIENVATGLTAAFNPQTLAKALDSQDPSWQSLQAAGATELKNSGDKYTAAVLNLVMGVIFGLMMAFILIATAVMLLIRYAYISVLLVLMPAAWMLWIFPNFKHLFSSWWGKFWRWAFFPPIMLFFLYVALFIKFNDKTDNYLANTAAGVAADKSAAGLATMTQSSTVSTISESIIVIALTLGGLIAANSFGIKFADTAMGGIKNASNWAKGRASRFGGKVTRAALNRPAGAVASRLLTIPGLRGAGMAIQGAVTGGNANLVSQEKETIKKGNLSKEQRESMLASPALMSKERRLALIETMSDDKQITDNTVIGGQSIGEFLKSNPDYFASSGKVKLQKELEDMSGLTFSNMAKERTSQAALIADKKKNGESVEEDLKKLDEIDAKILAFTQKNTEFLAKIYSGKPPSMLGDAKSDEALQARKMVARLLLEKGGPNSFGKLMDNIDNKDQSDAVFKSIDDANDEDPLKLNARNKQYFQNKGKEFSDLLPEDVKKNITAMSDAEMVAEAEKKVAQEKAMDAARKKADEGKPRAGF